MPVAKTEKPNQRLDTRNPCTRYNPFSRQQHGRTTDAQELPHTKKEWAVSLNIETTHPHSYIVNERCNLRNKRRETKGKPREKKKGNGKNRQLAQPQTLTQGGHEIASLLN